MLYAGIATILCLIIAFPLAYFIAYKAGRWKNFMLLLVVLPFFTSYVLRTVSWQLILNDNGWVVSRFQDVGLLGERRPPAGDDHGASSRASPTTSCRSWRCRCTSSLEKIDRRLIEAATDLYASRADRVPQGDAAAGAARASSPARC